MSLNFPNVYLSFGVNLCGKFNQFITQQFTQQGVTILRRQELGRMGLTVKELLVLGLVGSCGRVCRQEQHLQKHDFV
jgi:hypothetical protein